MLPAEQARGEALLALARIRFDPDLRDIEQQVLRHSCAYEDPPDWTPDRDTPDPTRDGTTGRPLPGWQGPELRPALLRWLLTDPEATALLEPRGLRVWNARLTDPLDLIGCRVSVRFELRYCLLQASILLVASELNTLVVRNSTLKDRFNATALKLRGPLEMEDIASVNVFCFDAATIEGGVLLARMTLNNIETTFSMRAASITGDLRLLDRFDSAGTLNLRGLRLNGTLLASCANLSTLKTAFDLSEGRVGGGVFLKAPFCCNGLIQIAGCRIDGQLNCEGARLLATNNALLLDQSEIKGSVLLRAGFVSNGSISFRGATLGGQLDCTGAQLLRPGDAISLDRAVIRDSVILRHIYSLGLVRMLGATIGGSVECDGAQLASAEVALALDSAHIKGHVYLRNDFESEGTIRLVSTLIEGSLECERSRIRGLVGESLEVGTSFFWRHNDSSVLKQLNLTGAKIASMYDEHTSWPSAGKLLLTGLRVENLEPFESDPHVTGRIAWLNRQPKDQIAEPQPWLHLASHFEAKGHKRAAKRVIYELRKHQSRANWKNSRFKHLGYFWDTRFGRLEQQPFFILIPILFLTLLSGTTFHAYRAHFAETSESAYKATHTPAPQTAPSYPKFQPLVYALENVLPVIKLGQDDKWAPDSARTSSGLYRTLVILRWFLILSGWVMGGILAAAVSARFRA